MGTFPLPQEPISPQPTRVLVELADGVATCDGSLWRERPDRTDDPE